MTEPSPSPALAAQTPSENRNPQAEPLPLPPLSSATVTAETLRHFAVFADLDESQRERLVSQMHPLTIPARTILLAAGQPGHAVYFLLEGTVKVGLERPTGPRTQKLFSIGKKEPKAVTSATGTQATGTQATGTQATGTQATGTQATGAQVMLNLCGPGAVLGELSVIDSLGHSATVTARGTCRLLWIDKDAFLEAMEQMPGLPYALLRQCSERLRNATQQLHAFATLDAAGRVASTLLRLAERFGVETPEGLRLEIGLMQPELADLTGLTRVSVNTALAAFRKKGWLELEPENGYLLHELESLSRIAHLEPPQA